MDDFVARLVMAFGPQSVLTGEAVAARRASYLDNSPMKARAILRPASTAEVAEMLRLCNAAGQTIVPHGGLTNLVDNTRTTENDLAISMERMDAVEEVDSAGGTMTVQAGAVLSKIQETAALAGLFFPLDLAARGSATLGGLIATNAGGTRVVRYGTMRDLVLGLEAVLADGTLLTSLNKMLKNNTGYDLKHLLIGSEGTLGVVTRAVLRVWPQPHGAATALVALDRFEQVIALLALAKKELGGQLASFEVMWNDFYRLTTLPPAHATAPLSHKYAFYVLLETLGPESSGEQARMEHLLEQADQQGLFSDAVIARSTEQRAALWRIREDSEQMETQYQPVFGFDISLPIMEMESYIDGMRASLEQAFGEVKLWVYGHAADGNLHLGVWGRSLQAGARLAVEALIYQPLLKIGGSISAEHGIGLEKKAYLSLSRTAQEIAVMRRLKTALDPHGILNPGKIFDFPV